MQYLKTALMVGSVALFTACGGGGGSSDPVEQVDPMTLKDGVSIIYHYPAEVCTSTLLREELQPSVPSISDLLIRVESNDVICATYGKTDGVNCQTQDMVLIDPNYEQYDTSCVIGFDLVNYTPTSNQLMEDIGFAAEFTLDAQ